MYQKLFAITIAVCSMGFLTTAAFAEKSEPSFVKTSANAPKQTAQRSKNANHNSSSKKTATDAQQREEQALDFARQHHPELEEVILRLREMDEKQYVKVIREIWRVSDRLAGFKGRNKELYEIQLSLWKARSNATLAAAKLQLDPTNEDLKEQLRLALENKFEANRAALKWELAKARERVEKLERSLKTLEASGSKTIQRELKRLSPPKN